MPNRIISFAGTTATVDYQGQRPAKIINFLFDDLPSVAIVPGESPQVNYQLYFDDEAGKFTLKKDGDSLLNSDSEDSVADTLLGNACHQLAWHSRGGLLFHAGGLAWQGRGLLLPGTMGAGKTTLTAWLLGRGFNYLSDEMVFFSHHTNVMTALPRPLNLKHPARPVLKNKLDYTGQHADEIYSAYTTDLVPPRLFNPQTRFSAPPLSLIIFPHFQADSQFSLQRLTKAQAGLELMKSLINARNLPGHGFAEISRIVKQVPACKMNYASFEQIGDNIEHLLAEK
jgi:hypothetical protein